MDKEQQRRFEEALRRKEQAEAARMRAEEESLLADERTPDDLDPRAKSTGHGKKTADKWNQ